MIDEVRNGFGVKPRERGLNRYSGNSEVGEKSIGDIERAEKRFG